MYQATRLKVDKHLGIRANANEIRGLDMLANKWRCSRSEAARRLIKEGVLREFREKSLS